jgi:6,7-dimethyl-8-ribityllumazine synthase
MNSHIPDLSIQTDANVLLANQHIAIVDTLWNSHITGKMRDEAIRVLKAQGIPDEKIKVYSAPGSFELPNVAKWILMDSPLRSSSCAGVICFGCVIRGGTPHFEYVSQSVTQGCTQVAIETAKPLVFGVLTVDNEYQAKVRVDGTEANKGVEAALTLLHMLTLKNEILSTKNF